MPVPGKDISLQDLNRIIGELDFCTATIVLQSCHSEHLANKLGISGKKERLNIVYSSAYNEKSSLDTPGNGFGYHFVKAALDTANGDVNHDGCYTLGELVNQAAVLKNESNRQQRRGGGFEQVTSAPPEHPGVISSFYGQGLFDHLGSYHHGTKCSLGPKIDFNSPFPIGEEMRDIANTPHELRSECQ